MKASGAIRLFLAIPPPDHVREAARRLRLELEGLPPERAIRWTRPEQLHLTLKFLGDVPETQTDALTRAVRTVADGAAPMGLRAEGTGFFPNDRSPRVLWMDIKSADGRLMEFQRQLESVVQPFTQKQEAKKFTAHVTLARMGRMRRLDTEKLKAATAVARSFGEWTATEAQLIQSSLLPSGPVYAILDKFRIKNV